SRVGCRLRFLPAPIAILTGSNGLWKPDTFTIATASLIGWKQISATDPDETKQSSSWRHGARRQMTTAKSCLKLRNSQPRFGEHAGFALKPSKRPPACLATLRRVWPDAVVETVSHLLSELSIAPVLSVVLGVRAARQGIRATLALPAFLQSYL